MLLLLLWNIEIKAAGASDGSFAFIYTPIGNPITVKLSKINGNRIKAQWYNPRQGKGTKIEEFSKTETKKFTPPTKGRGNDWILVLDNAASKFPPF